MAVDWITLSPANGEAGTEKITITRAEHTGTSQRRASITFRSDAGSKKVSVVQNPIAPYIKAVTSLNSFIPIKGAGETYILQLETNVSNLSIELTNSEGITAQASIGDQQYLTWKGLNSENWEVPGNPGGAAKYIIEIRLQFPENITGSTKSYDLTIKASQKNADSYDPIEFIYPDGKDKIILSQPDKNNGYFVLSDTLIDDNEDSIYIQTSEPWSSELS